jgi:hypothetical protein
MTNLEGELGSPQGRPLDLEVTKPEMTKPLDLELTKPEMTKPLDLELTKPGMTKPLDLEREAAGHRSWPQRCSLRSPHPRSHPRRWPSRCSRVHQL